MISNQILQTTLDGLKAITRIDLGICDTEGKGAGIHLYRRGRVRKFDPGICGFSGRQPR